MTRLPTPGSDADNWGTILNEFLETSHNTDGTIKDNIVSSTSLVDESIDNSKIATDANISQSKIANLTTDLSNKADNTITISGATSLTGGGDLTTSRTISLVNDSATPGNSYYYGTNASGTKGFHALPEGSVGEANTASNVGIEGIGIYKQKTGVDLEFKNIVAKSTKVAVTEDAVNNEVEIDVNEANFTNIPQSAVTDLGTDLGNAQSKILSYSKAGSVATKVGGHKLYNDTGNPWTIVSARASLDVAPAGSSLIVDINVDGTTIFTDQDNRLTIAESGVTSGKVDNMDVALIPDGSYITIDVDQVGSVSPGYDLTVQIEVR